MQNATASLPEVDLVAGEVAILLPSICSSSRQLDAVPISRVKGRDVPEIGVGRRPERGQCVRAPRCLEAEAAPSRRVVAHRRHRSTEAVRSDTNAKALAAQKVFPSKTVRIKSGVALRGTLSSQQEAGALEERPSSNSITVPEMSARTAGLSDAGLKCPQFRVPHLSLLI